MFTGIIEDVGIVKDITGGKDMKTLACRSCKISSKVSLGDSVAVNGVCLTVTGKVKDVVRFDCMYETMVKTDLGTLKVNDKVNLETALRSDALLSGHLVYGHVDGKRKILGLSLKSAKGFIEVGMEREDRKYIVDKGSVCLDGISLTVGSISQNSFIVYLIPLTIQNTALMNKKTGDFLNVEFDIVGKYIVNSLKQNKPITESFLKDHGF